MIRLQCRISWEYLGSLDYCLATYKWWHMHYEKKLRIFDKSEKISHAYTFYYIGTKFGFFPFLKPVFLTNVVSKIYSARAEDNFLIYFRIHLFVVILTNFPYCYQYEKEQGKDMHSFFKREQQVLIQRNLLKWKHFECFNLANFQYKRIIPKFKGFHWLLTVGKKRFFKKQITNNVLYDHH